MDGQLERTARALNFDTDRLRQRGVLSTAAEIVAFTKRFPMKTQNSQIPFFAIHLSCLQ